MTVPGCSEIGRSMVALNSSASPRVQETILPLVRPQKEFYALPQRNISTARVVEECVPLRRRMVFYRRR